MGFSIQVGVGDALAAGDVVTQSKSVNAAIVPALAAPLRNLLRDSVRKLGPRAQPTGRKLHFRKNFCQRKHDAERWKPDFGVHQPKH